MVYLMVRPLCIEPSTTAYLFGKAKAQVSVWVGGRGRIQLVTSTCRNNSDVFMQEIGLILFVFL